MTSRHSVVQLLLAIACLTASSDPVLAFEVGGSTPLMPALESGGRGCYDPEAWVWQAPRAERVAVERSSNAPCEIGTPDCERKPESGRADSDVVGEVVCAMKVGPETTGVKAFDAGDCVEAVMLGRAIALETLPPPEPRRVLACTALDPECVPLPPPTVPLETGSSPPPAALTALSPIPQPEPLAGHRWATLARELEGHSRRVDRPPQSVATGQVRA